MVNLEEEDIYSIKQRLVQETSTTSTTTTCPSFVLASKDLFFIWNGKPLNDDLVLADYMNHKNNNMHNTTIFVQERQRGGCFAVSFSVFIMILACILGSTCTCGVSLVMVPLLLPLLLVLPLFCL